MKIFAWATDIHLDCTNDASERVKSLLKSAGDADCLLVSGDISVAPMLAKHLQLLDSLAERPVYFVLGNHDFYFSDISTVRRDVASVCRSSSFLCYLSHIPFVKIEKNTALVGHDGWYDAGNGSVEHSQLIMNDWIKIGDYSPACRNTPQGIEISKLEIVNIARSICQVGVKHIAEGIKAAAREKNETIVVVTHVPPFMESYVPNEKKPMRVQDALPWYTCRMMGDMLLRAAKSFPEIKFKVFSGHVHSQYKGNILPNLEVRVGKSEYGTPQLAGIIPI